jgi:hypothetical protein
MEGGTKKRLELLYCTPEDEEEIMKGELIRMKGL